VANFITYELNEHVNAPLAQADDPVNQPSHYKNGGLEVIEILKSKLTPEEFIGYCKGNVWKYTFRHLYKGKPVEDLQKAEYYLQRLIQAQQELAK
jgi:hypothetical protein